MAPWVWTSAGLGLDIIGGVFLSVEAIGLDNIEDFRTKVLDRVATYFDYRTSGGTKRVFQAFADIAVVISGVSAVLLVLSVFGLYIHTGAWYLDLALAVVVNAVAIMLISWRLARRRLRTRTFRVIVVAWFVTTLALNALALIAGVYVYGGPVYLEFLTDLIINLLIVSSPVVLFQLSRIPAAGLKWIEDTTRAGSGVIGIIGALLLFMGFVGQLIGAISDRGGN